MEHNIFSPASIMREDRFMEHKELAVVECSGENEVTEAGDASQIALIRELQPTSHSRILEARAYRKWTAITFGKKDQTGFSGRKKETAYCCIFIDQEGDAIQANMDVKERDYFDSKIKLGMVYRISDFICEPTNPYQQTISNKTSLRFGRATKFNPIEAPAIPHHYFEFASYNHLESRIPREDARGKMQYPILTDYIGCLRSPGEVTRRPNSSQGDSIFRKVDIENLAGNVVEFTMWDDMALKFEDNDFRSMENPIIIAVTSCRVSKFRDYQLTATSATHYYLNPHIPDVQETRARYKERHEKNPPLHISKTPYEDTEKEKLRNRFPLKTLLKTDPDSYIGVKFTSEATISGINPKRDWFYISCSECPLKVTEEDGIYRCINHGKLQKPSYRYNFKGYITDVSATVPITFFTPAADDIIGYSCPELLANHKADDLQQIPEEIFALEGQKNIFQFHFNTSSQTIDFNLDQVFNKKKRQESTSNLLEPPLETLPSHLALMEKDSNEEKEQQQDEPLITPTLLSPLSESTKEMDPLERGLEQSNNPLAGDERTSALPETPIQFVQQEPLPPPLKEKGVQESKSKTVKRPLFQQEPPESKKQKVDATLVDTMAEDKPRTRAADKKKQN